MKVIFNDKLLDNLGFFRRIKGITLFPYIILREKDKKDKVLLNHEKIHINQQKELLIIFFYIWYILEYVLKGFSYHRISFEKEAYENQDNLDYLNNRKRYSFLKYINYNKHSKYSQYKRL